MAEPCDLCTRNELDLVYEPADSRRGLKIYACRACGLVQSLPRRDRAPRANMQVSSGADWGNLRYGKGFRVAEHMKLLAQHGLTPPAAILDVGANRGAFIERALEAWPAAQITAVEPDERVTRLYENRPHVELVRARIEDCGFEAETFDFIYSSHTLEHVAMARRVIAQHALVLKPGGLLLLEVPNIALIGEPDIVEEWFIDKHLFHFSAATLIAMLEQCGFEVLVPPSHKDKTYLTLLARLGTAKDISSGDGEEYTSAKALIERYAETRRANEFALKAAAAFLMEYHGRVAVWGAGRLFDALVRTGGLDARALCGLIDEGLRKLSDERFGLKLTPGDKLATLTPDLVVVASRSFAEEITGKVRALLPDVEILTFAELLSQSQSNSEIIQKLQA